MKFNVGDRVRVCKVEKYDSVSVGECGTVVKINPRNVTYGVRFDERDLIGKHNCDGLCEDGYGWWCDENMLEPANETKFKVGDRVRVCDARDSDEHVDFGECGVVRGIHPANDYHRCTCYSVQFDKFNEGRHTCLGLCDEGHGWNCDEEMLEPASASAFRGGKIPNVSFADYTDSLCDALRALGSVAYFKQTKEDKSMIFRVIDGERVDKTCNKKIQTKITEVRVGELEGIARCDADEYNERDGVLNAIANAVCGNFDREYGKFLAHKKHEYEASCKCAICGHTADKDGKPYTPEDARACEAAHEARKKAKREAWLEKREAAKRLRELERKGRIEEYMKQIAKRGKR